LGEDGRNSPVLTHNSDPLFGSTININFSAAPAPGPTSDHDTTLTGFDLNDQQQQLDQSIFDFNIFDIDLPAEFPSNTLPTEPTLPPGQLNIFTDPSGDALPFTTSSNSPPPRNQQTTNTAVVTSKFQCIPASKLSFVDIESCLLKRKAEGNTPKVVTKSIFNHIRNASPVQNPFPPTKLLKTSNTSSQFINGYNTLFGNSVYRGNGDG